MPSIDGSYTPSRKSSSHSSSSHGSTRDSNVYTHAEKVEFKEYYPEMLSHVEDRFKKYQPDFPIDSEEVLDHIIRPGPETALYLKHCDLVSIPVQEVVRDAKMSMCGLGDISEIEAREAVETFYREHLNDYVTLDTAQSWQEYGTHLATLLDAKSRWDGAKSGAKFVAAPRPPAEIKTEADLAMMDDIIEHLELQAEGISFVDVTSRVRPKVVGTREATDTVVTSWRKR